MAFDFSKMYYDPANSQANNPLPLGTTGVANYSGPIGPSKPGYVQGTADTVVDPFFSQPAPSPSSGGDGGGDGFDMSKYPGWGEAEARANYAATGGPGSQSEAERQAEFERQLQVQRELAQKIFDDMMARANQGYERGKGIYDEGKGLLQQRIGEFADDYDTNKQNIFNRFQDNRGSLQQVAGNQDRLMANSLRAQGVGGSGIMNYLGKQNQDRALASGNLRQSREANEGIAAKNNQENVTFTNTQSTALERYMQDLHDQRVNTENTASLVQAGEHARIGTEANNYYNQIQAQNAALAAANQSTGNYTPNAFNMNLPSTAGQLSNIAPSAEAQTPSYQGGTGIANEYNPFDPKKKYPGSGLYGLTT